MDMVNKAVEYTLVLAPNSDQLFTEFLEKEMQGRGSKYAHSARGR